MTTAGGGWTLVMKTMDTNDFKNSSSYWTDSNTLNTSDFNLTTGSSSKYDSWNDVSFNEVMVKLGNNTLPIITASSTSMFNLMNNNSGCINNTHNGAYYYDLPNWVDGDITSQHEEMVQCFGLSLNSAQCGDNTLARVGSCMDSAANCSGNGCGSAIGLGIKSGSAGGDRGSGIVGWYASEPGVFLNGYLYVR